MNEPRIAFELEVERARFQYPDWDALGQQLDAQVKFDGSLRDGREFASLTPRTLQEWRDFDLTDTLEAMGTQVAADRTTTAGLHLHLDRAAFSGVGLARVFTIVNHADLVVRRLSRRTRTRYCEFAPSAYEDRWQRIATDGLLPPHARRLSHSKYCAVFCHDYYPTVELRFFRATVQPDRFYAALETAHALWHYAEQLQDRPATGADWAAWAGRHPNYTTLRHELRARRQRVRRVAVAAT